MSLEASRSTLPLRLMEPAAAKRRPSLQAITLGKGCGDGLNGDRL